MEIFEFEKKHPAFAFTPFTLKKTVQYGVTGFQGFGLFFGFHYLQGIIQFRSKGFFLRTQ